MVWICKRLVESCSNASNLHSITSNLVRMLRIFIRMVKIPFESFEFARDWSNLARMLRICIRLLRITFECFEFSFEWLETLSICLNLYLIVLNLVWKLRICIRMVSFPVELFKSAFVCFDSHSNGSNFHSTG